MLNSAVEAANPHNHDIMEQISDAPGTGMSSSHDSPPQKKAKIQKEGTLTITVERDEDPPRGGELQQPTNLRNEITNQPLKDGIFNSHLPSDEETNPTPAENLEPNSAGLKSSRTRGVCHKSLEESHSARIKERSLLGHLMCPECTQQKILESDIFRTLGSEGVTEIGALCKVSSSKFVLVFGSKTAKEKLENTAIQCRFGDLILL